MVKLKITSVKQFLESEDNTTYEAAKVVILPIPFTVVQIDAHGDMRHEFEGSIYNHACVMRRILDMGLYNLPVGIRSICKEEALLIEEKQITVIWKRDIRALRQQWIQIALEKLKTKLAPLGDSVVSEFTTAKLIYKLIGSQATTQGW